MSEFATPSPAASVTNSAQPSVEEEYERLYGVSADYAAPASGLIDPAHAQAAYGHYAEDPAKDSEDSATFFDLVGRSLDVAGTAGGGSEFLEKLGALGALPGDVLKTKKAVEDGELLDGVASGSGVISDVATMAGLKPVAMVAGLSKGGTEIHQGIEQFDKGIQNDNGQMQAEAIRKGLDGLADSTAAVPEEHIGAFGKALGFGLTIGDAWAPTLMGDKNVSSDVQKEDGTFVPSTGNRAVDWVLGEGKFSDSRFDSDGADAEERAEKAAEQEANREWARGYRADMNRMVEEAAPEDRENAERQRAIIESMTGISMTE